MDRTHELAALNQSLRLEIAQRQKAQQALQESEKRFQALVDAIFEGVVVHEGGKIIEANPGFARMFGYTLEEVIGKSAADFLTPESLETFLHQVENQSELPYEITGIHKDGRLIQLEVVGKQSWYQGRSVRVSAARDITEHKQAQEALRESQIQLQRELAEIETIYQSAPIGLNVLDTDLRFVRINERLAQINGFPVEAHIGRTVRELLPDLADAAEQLLRPILETGQPVVNVEITGETPAQPGVKRTWLESFLPLKDGERIIGISTVCEEITERKQAQEKLRKSEYLYRTLAHNFPNGAVHIFDHDLRYLLCDGTEISKMGLSKEQLEGKTLWETLSPETSAVLEPCYRAALAGEATITELTFGDRIYQIYALPLFNEQGEIFAGLSMSQNITLQKQAEQTLKTAKDELERQVQQRTKQLSETNEILQQREREFRTLVENTPDVITRHNRQYRYLYLNPAATRESGMPVETYLGKAPSELGYPQEITDFWEASLEDVFTTGKIRTDEYRVINQNEAKVYQTYVVPELGTDGAVESVLTITRDITALRVAEESSRQLTEELKRSNQELEQFAYVASHDLQEPLRAITSFTQMLAKRYQGQLDAKADTYIEFIVDGAMRMQQLVKDLLAYSRVGRHELKLQAVDCNAILERVKKDLQVKIAETQALIIADPLPTVMADPSQLSNLLLNLISNSLKYRGDIIPKIYISVKRNTLKLIGQDLAQTFSPLHASSHEEWIFSVQDNGIGMEMQYAQRIFCIFQRLHTSDEYSGTGLGLAICKKIVERHGGRIWVESQLGQGATFHFSLPIVH